MEKACNSVEGASSEIKMALAMVNQEWVEARSAAKRAHNLGMKATAASAVQANAAQATEQAYEDALILSQAALEKARQAETADDVEARMNTALQVATDLADKADLAAAEAKKSTQPAPAVLEAAEAAKAAKEASDTADQALLEAKAKAADAKKKAAKAAQEEAKAEEVAEEANEDATDANEDAKDEMADYMNERLNQPSNKVITCGSDKKCNGETFSFNSADGLIRLDCRGKDACNSVDLECKDKPTYCSVTCEDGEPACNSLTVTPGIAVTCSPEKACNSVDPQDSVVFVPPPANDQVAGQPNGHTGGVFSHIGLDFKTKMNANLLSWLNTDSMQG